MAIGRRRILPTAWTTAEIGRSTRRTRCSICILRTSAIRASAGTRNATTGSWQSLFRESTKSVSICRKISSNGCTRAILAPLAIPTAYGSALTYYAYRRKENTGPLWALKVGLNPGAPQGGSGEQYFLGEFDGTSFKVSDEEGAHGWTNYGKDDYCAISFNGIPPGGQPVLLGWMNNWDYAAKLPTSPWRGQMSLARKLSLIRDQNGLALAQDPVIDSLRKGAVPLHLEESSGNEGAAATLSPPYELDFEEVNPSAKSFGVRIYYDDQHWTEIGFDKAKGEFYIDRTRSGDTSIPGFAAKTTAPVVAGRPYNVKVIIDRSSVEAFAQNGTIAMTNLVYPPTASNRIVFFPSSSPQTANVRAHLWKLASVWQGADRGHGPSSR